MAPPLGVRDPARHALFPDVERIAVLHSRGLGDLVFALPALRALRAAYPRAELTLLGRNWYVPFLAERDVVHRVVPVPYSHGVNDDPKGGPPITLDEFFAEQAAEGYDLAVQMHGGGRNSNPFVLRLEARHTVGARTPDAPHLERSMPFVHYQNEIMRGLEVVGLAGAAPVELEPVVPVTAADLEEAAQVLEDLGLDEPGGAPVVALHPGASDTRRWWPAERFAAVGDALQEAGARIVVTGVPHERAIVERVTAAMRGRAVSLCGRLRLNGLTGLLSRCALVVSNDTGPLHLAQAVGTPTVGIFWCGNLINAGPFTRRRHRPTLSWQLDCPVCGVDNSNFRCPHDDSFVARVTVDEVRDHALDLLGIRG